ncbi:MAG: hypothetical protein FWE22_04500 [Firmicutes bacterium]|nr:hypothetical protein [Bacillota bacterium]
MPNTFKQTIIVAGWYGTGKTEFCLNLALHLAKQNVDDTLIRPLAEGADQENNEGVSNANPNNQQNIVGAVTCRPHLMNENPDHPNPKIYLADLDVINPYFRSREKVDFLKQHNVEIIGNNLNSTLNQDIPAIDNRALSVILRGEQLIVDLAGSLNGLKPLSLFKRHLKEGDYDFFVVLNAFRCDVNTDKEMIEFIQNAELMSGLKVTGIINNSHMLHLTTPDLIIESQTLIDYVAKKVGIPVRLTLLKSDIHNQLKDKINSPVLSFDKPIMREEWQ